MMQGILRRQNLNKTMFKNTTQKRHLVFSPHSPMSRGRSTSFIFNHGRIMVSPPTLAVSLTFCTWSTHSKKPSLALVLSLFTAGMSVVWFLSVGLHCWCVCCLYLPSLLVCLLSVFAFTAGMSVVCDGLHCWCVSCLIPVCVCHHCCFSCPCSLQVCVLVFIAVSLPSN